MDEPFTQVPNRLLRSDKLDVFEKLILICIMSCGAESFPSYEKLGEWAGCCREKVWKSLRKLESFNLIMRRKVDKKIYYTHHWISSPDELIIGLPVRYTNSISSPDELEPVRQTNPIKNSYKELLKRDLKFSEKEENLEERISEILDHFIKGNSL